MSVARQEGPREPAVGQVRAAERQMLALASQPGMLALQPGRCLEGAAGLLPVPGEPTLLCEALVHPQPALRRCSNYAIWDWRNSPSWCPFVTKLSRPFQPIHSSRSHRWENMATKTDMYYLKKTQTNRAFWMSLNENRQVWISGDVLPNCQRRPQAEVRCLPSMLGPLKGLK